MLALPRYHSGSAGEGVLAMSDEVTSYLSTKKALDDATARCEQHAATFAEIGNAFRTWREVGFSNLGVGYPAGAIRKHIDGQRWPDPKTVAEDLSVWHQARHELENAWSRVPPELRSGLVPPPSRS